MKVPCHFCHISHSVHDKFDYFFGLKFTGNGFTRHRFYIYVMTPVTMNRITISLILLAIMSFIFPTSAIIYASGQSTDNSVDSSTGGSTDNSGLSSTTGGGTTTTTDNSGLSSTTSTQNSAALPSGSTVSNNTGNAYCDTCNNDIYFGGGDLKSMVLAVHNRERAAVGVPPLVWNDTLAIGAKTWAEHLATLKVIDQSNAHSSGYIPRYEYGESIATGGHNTTVPVAQNMQSWVAEKNNYHGGPITATNFGSISHYTMMVWRTTTSVGCGTASSGPNDILVCHYSPGPTHGGGNVFGENPY